MDSLLNRLRPEYLEVLAGMDEHFPCTKERIIMTLGALEWPGDVKLGDCITIASFLADDKIDLYNFREMFYKFGDNLKKIETKNRDECSTPFGLYDCTPSVIIYNGEL